MKFLGIYNRFTRTREQPEHRPHRVLDDIVAYWKLTEEFPNAGFYAVKESSGWTVYENATGHRISSIYRWRMKEAVEDARQVLERVGGHKHISTVRKTLLEGGSSKQKGGDNERQKNRP